MTKIRGLGRMLGIAFLVLFACYGLHGAVMEIHHTLAQEIGIPEKPIGTPVTTPLPMTGRCTPNKGEFTVPNPLPGGGWTVESRFYDAGDPRPEKYNGRASGTFDAQTSCGVYGSQKAGYDEVRVEITRNGLGVGVEVDVIRHAKEGE